MNEEVHSFREEKKKKYISYLIGFGGHNHDHDDNQGKMLHFKAFLAREVRCLYPFKWSWTKSLLSQLRG